MIIFFYLTDSKIKIKPEHIEDISKDVKELVRAAKYGKWPIVWSILRTPEKTKKTYLINCIPEDRRWSTLHQAVYLNNIEVVKLLLRHNACDPNVETKSGASEGHGFETPLDISKLKQYDTIMKMFANLELRRVTLDSPTYASKEFGLMQ